MRRIRVSPSGDRIAMVMIFDADADVFSLRGVNLFHDGYSLNGVRQPPGESYRATGPYTLCASENCLIFLADGTTCVCAEGNLSAAIATLGGGEHAANTDYVTF